MTNARLSAVVCNVSDTRSEGMRWKWCWWWWLCCCICCQTEEMTYGQDFVCLSLSCKKLTAQRFFCYCLARISFHSWFNWIWKFVGIGLDLSKIWLSFRSSSFLRAGRWILYFCCVKRITCCKKCLDLLARTYLFRVCVDWWMCVNFERDDI